MVDTRFNNGLPPNLSGASPERCAINHGLKAVHIGASAWTAEALKLTMPATAFSRSTENHNQDKVSMGSIAARDCLRVIELTEQVAAACLLGVSQGLRLRMRQGEIEVSALSTALHEWSLALAKEIKFITEDRPLEKELRQLLELIRKRHWTLYDND